MNEDQHVSKPHAYLVVAFLGLSILFTSVGVSNILHRIEGMGFAADSDRSKNETPDTLFPEVAVQAKAAIVYDIVEERVLYQKNAEAQLPLASLSKVMMAYATLKQLEEDVIVTMGEEFLADVGEGVRSEGEQWVLRDLLEATLVESSNNGATAIAGAYASINKVSGDTASSGTLVEAMNRESEQLGLTQTFFLNETGLDIDHRTAGAYGSAYDMARLMAASVRLFPEVFEATRYRSISLSSLGNTTYTIENTNSTVNSIPGIIASKTGYTRLSGGNLAVVVDVGPAHPVSIVVLGSSEEGREDDVRALVAATFKYVTAGE